MTLPARLDGVPALARPTFYLQYAISPVFDDWHPDVYSKYTNPETIVEAAVSTGATWFHINSKDHSGKAHYVTELDVLHRGFRGRDAFGELLDALHARGIRVMANQSIFFDHHLFVEHPDWRVRDDAGRDSKAIGILGNRPGIVCMNSPYAELAVAQLDAFVKKYPVDAVFLDMVWISIPICHCHWCAERYRADTGHDLPAEDARGTDEFRAYARWRNARLTEFTKALVDAVRRARPGTLITLNSPRPHMPDYVLPIESIVPLVDFMCGDPLQNDNSLTLAGLTASVWYNLTPVRPAQIAVSRFHGHESQCVGMVHTDRLKIISAICLAHNASVQMHDILRPDGSLAKEPTAAIASAFDFIRPRSALAGGEKIRCVAIYVSDRTRDFHLESVPHSGPFVGRHEAAEAYASGVTEAYLAFQRNHVPVDVITTMNLDLLGEFDLIVLPDAECLADREIEAFREYVRAGGNLIATRFSSLRDEEGRLRDGFGLADVFGVDLVGRTGTSGTYIRPDEELSREAGVPVEELGFNLPQALVKIRDGAAVQVLGRIALPYTDLATDRDRWVSIFGNPASDTEVGPAIVVGSFGDGSVCYISGSIAEVDAGMWSFSTVEAREVLYRLARRMLGDRVRLEMDGHPSLDMVAYWQADAGRYLIHLVNCQDVYPVLPVAGATITFRPPASVSVRNVTALPDGEPLTFERVGSEIRVKVPTVQIHLAVAIEVDVIPTNGDQDR